jgi:hypothetical protein
MAAEKLMLSSVRCSFLTLGEPEQFQGKGKFRWSATFLVPADSPLKKMVDDAIVKVAKEKWPNKYAALLKGILTDPKGCCWMDGERKAYEGYEGHFALSAHRYQDSGRPLVIDHDKSPIYQKDNTLYQGKEGRIYSGCFVNGQIEIWAQDNNNGKGIRATLLGVQYVKRGDAFGGGSRPDADDFGEVADGADADEMGDEASDLV